MPLSNEDNLRLNVLMAQPVKAVRIDEGKMLVYALTSKGEAKIALNPNEKSERYLKQVKDFLSNKVLGVAGGFPVYLSHWNRMGEAKSNDLGKLLLLGEDEAVIAVVNSSDLTPDVASYAWWAYQGADNARSMLSHPEILKTDIAKELASFLLEFLPFEEVPENMLMSIRLVLQPGLISEEEKLQLWNKAKSKNTLYIGFMDTLANELPVQELQHILYDDIQSSLSHELASQNAYALKLSHILSVEGQSFIKTANAAFKRTPNQVVYGALLDSIRRYFAYPINEKEGSLYDETLLFKGYGEELNNNKEPEIDIHKIWNNCCAKISTDSSAQEIIKSAPELEHRLESLLFLANLSQAITYPVFSQSTCVGSLMRKKLKPVTDFILNHLRQLSLV